jgi:hypothetical protein
LTDDILPEGRVPGCITPARSLFGKHLAISVCWRKGNSLNRTPPDAVMRLEALY